MKLDVTLTVFAVVCAVTFNCKADAPSFMLTLRRTVADDATIVAPSNAVESLVHEADGVVRYEWKFAEGSPLKSFSAEVKTDGDVSRYRSRVVVSDGWHLERRAFPEIVCPRESAAGGRMLFMSGEACGGSHHVGFGNAALDEPLGKFCGECIHLERTLEVRSHCNDSAVLASGLKEPRSEAASGIYFTLVSVFLHW